MTIHQTIAIAMGDYSNEVRLLSEEDHLGQALAKMTQTLRQVVAPVNAKDQLCQALAKMTETLRETATCIVILSKS